MFRFIFLLLLIPLVHACKPSSGARLDEWMQPNGKVKVLCTTEMISSLVREVGGEEVDCLTLIQGESDPHSYQLVKGDDEKLAFADIIFYNGLGLEHGPSLAERLRLNPKAFAVGDFLIEKDPQNAIIDNGSLDPHIWMDVSLWEQTVPFISEKLAEKVPEKKAYFTDRADKIQAALQDVHEKIVASFQTLPASDRYLVSSHEAFNYFVRAYLALPGEKADDSWMIRCMAPEGLAPDSQLSTQDIRRLVNHIIEYDVEVLFAESNVSRDSLKKLQDACIQYNHLVQISQNPLYVDAMGPKGSDADTYAKMVLYDAGVISKGLSKKG